MFGTLRPHRCSLPAPDKERHARLYCGLCRTLGEDHGQPSRGLLSFDAVLVASVADALQVEAAPPARTRCPILPVVHRPTLHHTAVPLRFAAAVQVLLADQWVADRAVDGQAVARWVRPWGAAKVRGAQAVLHELGAPLDDLEGFEHRQHAVETAGPPSPEDAAAPTEDALRVVFAAIAHLPGSVPLAEADVAHLAALGGAVGRIVYFVDALEDLPRDQIQGGFNPCLADLPGHPGQTADPVRVEATCRALDTALDDAAARIDALPWARSRALLHNTLVDSQRRRGVRAKATARRHAGLLPPPAPAPVRQADRVLLAAMALATVWMGVAPRAFAQAGGPMGGSPEADDTGTPAPEAEGTTDDGVDVEGIWDFLDAVRAFAVEVARTLADWIFCLTDLPGLVDRLCTSMGQLIGQCIETTCDFCATTCQLCTGLDEACRDCGSCLECPRCCEGCSGCGAGTGPDCSGCGKPCHDCGQCCQGCEGCGQGCQGCGKGCQGGCCQGGGCQGGCCKGGGGGCCH